MTPERYVYRMEVGPSLTFALGTAVVMILASIILGLEGPPGTEIMALFLAGFGVALGIHAARRRRRLADEIEVDDHAITRRRRHGNSVTLPWGAIAEVRLRDAQAGDFLLADLSGTKVIEVDHALERFETLRVLILDRIPIPPLTGLPRTFRPRGLTPGPAVAVTVQADRVVLRWRWRRVVLFYPDIIDIHVTDIEFQGRYGPVWIVGMEIVPREGTTESITHLRGLLECYRLARAAWQRACAKM